MKKYENKLMERRVLVEHTCDICGSDIRSPKGFDFSEAHIEAHIGNIFPDNPCQIHYKLDLCRDCFENKVKPLIENEYNVEFQETED